MNEQTQQLVKRLYNECDELHDDPFGSPGYIFNEKKFASKIVQECLRALDPSGDLTSLREESGRIMAMRIIEEHFGVTYEKEQKAER